MELPTKVKFVDEKVKKAFESLAESSGDAKRLYEWLERAFKDS